MTYAELMKRALELEAMQDTEWADENAHLWDKFVEDAEKAYDDGAITGEEFDELVLTACYDYFGDLKANHD